MEQQKLKQEFKQIEPVKEKMALEAYLLEKGVDITAQINVLVDGERVEDLDTEVEEGQLVVVLPRLAGG